MATKTTALTVRFDGRSEDVGSIDEAVKAWTTYRDASGIGASDCHEAVVVARGTSRVVARISYNGRVWPSKGAA